MPTCFFHRRSETARFRELLRGPLQRRWDAVLDFVGFTPDDVEPIVTELGCKVGHYIFISSDSVYMCCDRDKFVEVEGWASSVTPGSTEITLTPMPARLDESSAVRPADSEARVTAAKLDDYGNGKLEIETMLNAAQEANGFPFTALRLPDVLGPNENTGRMTGVFERIISGQAGLRVCGVEGAGAKLPLGVVYSEDVAAAVCACLRAGKPSFGQAINIAANETVTWADFVQMVAQRMRDQGHNIGEMELAPNGRTGFLSVDIGAISVSKACRLLDWKPTPMDHWLNLTVSWWLMKRFHGEV